MAVVGYARVSTEEQTLDLQRDALHQAGVEILYEDQASGKTTARPELQQCLKALREGDTLIVWRLDRLGRNLQDLIVIVFERELMRERTLAGIAAARARGRKGGRRHVLNSKQREAVLSLLKSRDISVQDISRQFGVSRSTIYNILKST